MRVTGQDNFMPMEYAAEQVARTQSNGIVEAQT
jgi:hypothetical protein